MAARRFGFTMSDQLYDDIKRAAESGVSMSEFMCEAIRNWVLEADGGAEPARR
jgi:metal-responsive CopG/Arc/MetJ family transcriptional regulator